jgi:hypothetical protein
MTMNRFIVMTASAKMPSRCWGRYGRVAVVETDLPAGEAPKMIGTHARGVVRIVDTWERRNMGSSNRNAFAKAVVEAEALANKLNAEHAHDLR